MQKQIAVFGCPSSLLSLFTSTKNRVKIGLTGSGQSVNRVTDNGSETFGVEGNLNQSICIPTPKVRPKRSSQVKFSYLAMNLLEHYHMEKL